MIWRDLIINYEPCDRELISVFSHVFDVDETQIEIIDSLENASFDVAVICVLTMLPGLFCTMLSFYLDFTLDDEIFVISQICKQLKCNALISDDSTFNPYSMILVNSEGNLTKVEVNPNKLDEAEEYKVLN